MHRTYIFTDSNLILQKLKTELKNFQHSCHTITLSKSTIIAKNADFLQENADISKIKGALVLKVIFSETTYGCVLTYQISSVILKNFRQEFNFTTAPPTHIKMNP